MPEVPPRIRLRSFHELMQHRVQRILLISSLYDSFIMSEEGHLHETLLTQFIELNLTSVPDLVRVSSGEEALALLRDETFDVVVSSLRTTDGDAAEFTRQARELGYEVPVIALAYTHRDLSEFRATHDTSELERIFLWQGDVRILLAIVTYLEDRLNVANDTGCCGVPVIILAEDNIRFYSSFLPAIYSELYKHTSRLLSEDLNLSQRMMRLRARPKVILCDNFEDAWGTFERYRDQVLGVISDFEFPMGGELSPDAGIELCSRAQDAMPGLRLVMQSSVPENRERAEALGASFLRKGSPTLLHELRTILVERFGFGDFLFRLPSGKEIDRAVDLRTLAAKLETVPDASLRYHVDRNQFSNWMKARTEFALAERLRPIKNEDFEEPAALRRKLLESVHDYRRERQRTVIAEFERERFEPSVSITRIGGGSLGGKARGIAFANRILRGSGIADRYPGLDIHSPPAVVLGTQVFDEFLEYIGLRDYAIAENPDREIPKHFLDAPFPREAGAKLRAFLERVRYPLAVRSSSLLEDSISQPFAGVYETFMLPNNALDLEARWQQLALAIKAVYASAFTKRAKAYLAMTSFRLEEEKMGVMIQELVGHKHGDRFYPDFAGVARSYNYYPDPGHAPEDGVVAVGLGLGHTVVGGGSCLRFCPKYPRQVRAFSSVDDALSTSQRDFIALDLAHDVPALAERKLTSYPLSVAEEDGTLAWIGSTFSPENNVVVDGIAREGVRLVSFAQVLKHGAFPLPELLTELLHECATGTGAPVEIEFAGSFGARESDRPRFAFLQLRPLALSREEADVELLPIDDDALVCRSPCILGNGRVDGLLDLVVVDAERFDRMRTRDAAREVARFDAALRAEGRPYLLIGPGRWGSSDPSLGIPVGWNEICGARVIVEAGFEDIRVAPSQGTHFFQNLSSSQVGYLTINAEEGQGHVDWAWLAAQPAADAGEFARHIRLGSPLIATLSAQGGEGRVEKPAP